jgi:signal transduction histidine kinase
VDSLQPVHGDLTTVLGMLRYRLQPRLDAAGISLSWDVPDLPSVDRLSPTDILQIHRILLEAFTNVLKHAQATAVTATVRLVGSEPSIIELVLCDNGIGLPADAASSPGHGLKNMRLRAQALGAVLSVGTPASPPPPSACRSGTELRLSLPLD